MRRSAFALLLVLAAVGPARAQTLEARLRSQLTATVAELRDLKSGQAALTAQKEAAEKERDVLKARLAAAEAALHRTSERPAGPSEIDLAKARSEQLAQDQGRLDAAVAENRRLSQELAQVRAEHDRAAAELAANGQALGMCRAKHADLTALAKDMMAAYDRRSGAGLIRREPVTGLGRVSAQAQEQAFADRLYSARLDAKPKDPTPAPSQQAQ